MTDGRYLTAGEVSSILQEAGLAPVWMGKPPAAFSAIRSDSRHVKPGDLFCAIPGTRVDGHHFVPAAADNGAGAAVVERALESEIPQLKVANGREAVSHLASAFAGDPGRHMTLVGVTGTNGKSTTAWLIRWILAVRGPAAALGTLGTVHVDGSIGGPTLTTPDPIDLAQELAELALAGATSASLEVSSHALDQRRVHGFQFAAAAFTSFSREHLEYHPDMASYRAAKLRLLDLLAPGGTCAVDDSEPAWDGIRPAAPGATVLRYGTASGADVKAEEVELAADGCRFRLRFEGASADVSIPLPGDFNVRNALAAAAVTLGLGIDLETIATRLSTAPTVPGRMEVLNREPFVIRDFAHNPDSCERALQTLRDVTDGQLIGVLGCGGDRDPGKRPIMGEILARLTDIAIVTADNPRSEDPVEICGQMVAGLDVDEYKIIIDRCEAISFAVSEARAGDVVVLLGKGHETTQVMADRTIRFDERRIVSKIVGSERSSRPRSFTSAEVRRALGLPTGGGERVYSGVSIDSRTVVPGELFVALDGERYAGSDFLPQAAERGAVGAIIPVGRAHPDLGLEYSEVQDPVRALAEFAIQVRRESGATVVAVTGSSGKTTVKEMIGCALSETRAAYCTEGNLNSQVGLPLTILRSPKDADTWVLEAGTSEIGELRRLSKIACPDIIVVTTVGAAHLECLGSIEGVTREKLSLLDHASREATLIVGEVPPLLVREARARKADAVVAGLGPSATLVPESWSNEPEKVEFTRSGERFTIAVGGEHHLRDAVLAVAVSEALGVPASAAARGLASYRPIGMRGAIKRIGDLTVLADCYNANPDSFAAAINHAAQINPLRRHAVFAGSMLELGEAEEESHSDVATHIAKAGFGLVAATGLFVNSVFEHGNGRPSPVVLREEDPAKAIAPFVDALEGNEVILVKGSRGSRLERVIDYLEARFGVR